MTKTLEKATRVWEDAKEFLSVPRTEREYKKLVSILDELLTEIGGDERHSFPRHFKAGRQRNKCGPRHYDGHDEKGFIPIDMQVLAQ